LILLTRATLGDNFYKANYDFYKGYEILLTYILLAI